MSLRDAKKFFKDNIDHHATLRSDPMNYNLNAGLLNLVEQLDRQMDILHREIAQLSQQVANLQR
jgi:hypothetical protein